MSASIRLQSGDAVAEIAPLGAELRAWSVAGHPLLWSPDPAVWDATAPLLFPVVGWTRGGVVQIDGETYPLGLHGFARALPFEVSEQGSDWARLTLRASAESRRQYPFAFEFTVLYRLIGSTLSTELIVHNSGTEPLPYACGLHPGFRWPFAGGELADYTIEFAEPEASTVPAITAQGLFSRRRRAIPIEGRRLALSAALLEDEALCFLNARSRKLQFIHAGGTAITVTLEDFPHIALWSRPEGRFLSIESWTGHGDMEDADGDLWTKPSMIHLAPGATRRHAAAYGFVSG